MRPVGTCENGFSAFDKEIIKYPGVKPKTLAQQKPA
jgi:hypothetical protein